jgi:hypothetical protein
MKEDKGFQQLGSLFANRQKETIKAPAYEWQDLALRVINELRVPGFKRNSVFKVCKEKPKEFIEGCLNDTKELCKTGESWKYFFKIVGGKNNKNEQIK